MGGLLVVSPYVLPADADPDDWRAELLGRYRLLPDLVFGLLELLGISYRPALADLPDVKGIRNLQEGRHALARLVGCYEAAAL